MPQSKQPTELKRIKGTLRPSRELDNQLTFEPLKSIPEPPKEYKKDMAKLWFACCSSLVNVNLLFSQDLPLLAQYVFSVHMVQRSQSEIIKLGAIQDQTNKGGFEYQSKTKWIAINLDYSKEATRLGREFGFTPSGRTAIAIPDNRQTEMEREMFGPR